LWKLRGVQVDPAAGEAVREQNQLRHRQTRLLNHGWTSDGRLWVAWRLPASTNSVVLGVPGAMLRYLSNRSFSAFAKDSGRASGNIAINDIGSSYAYSPFLRYEGTDENDTFVAEFDLPKSDVWLSKLLMTTCLSKIRASNKDIASAWSANLDCMDRKRLSDHAAELAGSGGFHELYRGLKQIEIFLVLSRIGAVDLYPFPRANHTARLKRDDIAP
jgi:hypothetical protein